MAAGIEQAPVVLLAVDFHQRVGERAQRLGGHPAVVDKGLAPAVDAGGARWISSSPAGQPGPGNSARAACSGRRRNAATASPSDAPGGRRRRGPASRARSRGNRAGSTCRRRSRLSAR